MDKHSLFYSHNGVSFKGYVTYNSTTTEKRPAILVAHAWRGQDDFARQKAEELASLGYVALAVDYYGDGKEVQSSDEAAALMLPLFQDRALLLARMQAAFRALQAHPLVDPTKIGGIGFCFGGLAIIELFRSGVPLTAVASFHALLGHQMGDIQAKKLPLSKDIQGSILILHGYNDPSVSESDIRATQKELDDAHIDWQMHTFGGTMHAFMVPGTNSPQSGLKYNERSAARAWRAMQEFFREKCRI